MRPRPVVPRLTLSQLWLAIAIVLPGLAGVIAPLSTVDLAYQLRAGAAILDGGGIPGADRWTFTVPGQPWLDQQWLAQVILAEVWRLAGWTGLVVLRVALISAAWACLVAAIRRTNPGLGAREVAGLAILALVVGAPALALRPQLLGVFLFCLVLALLAARRQQPRLAWAVPVVVAVWANVHGSFVLGPALAGIAWLDDLRVERSRSTGAWGSVLRASSPTLAVAVTSALAMLVTPIGPGALTYALTLSANRQLAARITEWQPPSVADPTGAIFFGSLVLVAVVVVIGRRRVAWPALLTLALFGGLALLAARGVAWWPPAAVVALAPLLPSIPMSARRDRPRLPNTAIAAVLVALAVILLPVGRPADPGLGLGAPRGVLRDAPPGITAALRGVVRAGDRIWNPQPWGSWLELALPEASVAVDSRIELFPATVWDGYDVVAGGVTGWQGILDRYGATILVAAASQDRLLAAAGNDPGWRQVAASVGEGAVFVRSSRPASGS